MNKRKRTAYQRAAMWRDAEPTNAINPDADARVTIGKLDEVVFARGACADDGCEMARLFPDQWETLLSRHLDARRAGEIPGAEMLVVATDDGSARERFRADMARAKVAGIVWLGAEDVAATVTPVTMAGE